MNHSSSDAHPDKRWVGRSFGAAAHVYDGVAGLQRAVGARLLSRLPESIPPSGVIVDVGTGTGYFALELKKRYPDARLIGLDIAEGMLRVARDRFESPALCPCVCGDAEALPLADRSVDLIFSNLAIQWCLNLGSAFREFRRVLKPGGRALFSTFGMATLTELRTAWAAVDAYSHVNAFPDRGTVAMALRDAGCTAITLDSETRELEHADVYALMRELKSLGAHNVTAGRPRHLTGKQALRAMVEAYPARLESGAIRASFEIFYGCLGGG